MDENVSARTAQTGMLSMSNEISMGRPMQARLHEKHSDLMDHFLSVTGLEATGLTTTNMLHARTHARTRARTPTHARTHARTHTHTHPRQMVLVVEKLELCN